ncbi:hypothetical protein QB607_003155 [Clostridium botulinum]|nr:hypothetical protein [Clostridium botulinum]EKS4395828.1 hypothetical protein [Clostridium botulinum]
MDIVNGIEIYSISRDASSEIIRRKLTALVLNAIERKRIFKNKITCRFGGCYGSK